VATVPTSDGAVDATMISQALSVELKRQRLRFTAVALAGLGSSRRGRLWSLQTPEPSDARALPGDHRHSCHKFRQSHRRALVS
jgi:hypothetical protein